MAASIYALHCNKLPSYTRQLVIYGITQLQTASIPTLKKRRFRLDQGIRSITQISVLKWTNPFISCQGLFFVIPIYPHLDTHISLTPSYTLLISNMVTTRNRTYTHPAEGHEVLPHVETLTERRIRWSNLLQHQHYQPVISEVLDEELPKYENSTILDAKDRTTLMRECALILASAPLVFAAAVDGNLLQRISRDSELRKEYEDFQERAHSQPSIYIHLLADDHGVAPTPRQYTIISKLVNDYLSEGQISLHAWYVDNVIPPFVGEAASAQGHRKYLQTKHRSATRVETLLRFCDGVQRRFNETPELFRDKPFQFPPGECGYSKDSHIRLAQHRAHQSSNYVMNLVEDICTYLHRTKQFEQHFRMHQFIVYLIFRPTQAAIAEIFCSGLLQVWVGNGGGFNAYPAGRSVATARRLSAGDWSAHEVWVREMSPVDENMRVQRERAREWRDALEWGPVVAGDTEMAESHT